MRIVCGPLLRVERGNNRMQRTGDLFACLFPSCKHFLTYIYQGANVNTLQVLGFPLPPWLKVPHSVILFSVLYWKLEIVGAQAMEWRQFFPASVAHLFTSCTLMLENIRFFSCHAVVSNGTSRWCLCLTQRSHGHCPQGLRLILLFLGFCLTAWQRKNYFLFI